MKMVGSKKGRIITPQWRKKISIALKGRTPTVTQAVLEGRKRRTEKLKGRPLSPIHRAKIGQALKGKPHPWQVGKKFTKERKEKMAKAQLGRKIPLEIRRKLAGENHWNWKGGRTSLKNLRKSFEYKLWREAVFKRDNFICQMCGKRGGKLQADHILSFTAFPTLRLSIDNGRTLCRKCHYLRHSKKVKL